MIGDIIIERVQDRYGNWITQYAYFRSAYCVVVFGSYADAAKYRESWEGR